MLKEDLVKEFVEHGKIEDNLKMIEYGAKIKEVCDRHKCSLEVALSSIRLGVSLQVGQIYIKGL